MALLGPWGFGPKWPKTLEFRAFENPGILKSQIWPILAIFGPLGAPGGPRARNGPPRLNMVKDWGFGPNPAKKGQNRGPRYGPE